MCETKSAWLPDMCGAKSALLPSMCGIVCKFAPHMDGNNADFDPHIEGTHADFAPHMERRHSFRDQIIAKTASFANFQRELFKTTNILGVYMTYVITFFLFSLITIIWLQHTGRLWCLSRNFNGIRHHNHSNTVSLTIDPKFCQYLKKKSQ